MTLKPERVARSFFNPVTKSDEDYDLALRVAVRLVEEHRNLDCPAYDRCLNHAACSRWPSFTCSQCPHRKGEMTIVTPKIDNPRLRLL